MSKVTHDIWVHPLKLGVRRRCIGCNQLVLRKGGKRGPKPKFCTHKCYLRTHRRKTYIKNQEWYKEYSRNYRKNNPQIIQQKNQYYREQRKARLNWKYSYLETLKV